MTKYVAPSIAVIATMSAGLGLIAPVMAADSSTSRVGLSLFFRNGVMAPITFVGNPSRYLNEIDIVSTAAPGSVDAGVQPLITNGGDFSVLNWTGVRQVEEEWKTATNGTFTRVRYYRGASWMTQLSIFTLRAVDASGN